MSKLQDPAPTFDDVWRTIQELVQISKETERQMKERAAETERQMKERAAEIDRQIAETGREIQETARQIKSVNKKLGELGNRLGEFVEHMVAPAVVRLFQQQGIEVHEVHPSVEAKRNGEAVEIDLLVVNDGVLVAVECKSKLTHEHVEGHLARMGKLKQLLPHYSQCRAFGAVAAMVMSESVRTYAHNQGLYVLYQNGDSVEVGNPSGFSPKVW